MREGRQGRENAQCLDENPLGKKECIKKYTRIKQYAKRLKASDESYQDGRNNHTHKTMRKKQKKNNKKINTNFPLLLYKQTESIRKMKK